MYGQLERLRKEKQVRLEEDRRFVEELCQSLERMRNFLELLRTQCEALIELEAREVTES